jgi:parvulin-like peptidyl-prolyl isomerase
MEVGHADEVDPSGDRVGERYSRTGSDMRQSWCVGRALAAAVLAGLAGGCAVGAGERPLSAAMFLPPAAVTGDGAADPDVAALPEPAKAAVPPGGATVGALDATSGEVTPKKAMILTPIQPFDAVRPLAPLEPAVPAAASPTTAPAVDVPAPVPPTGAAPAPADATSTGVSPGVYMTLGGVLAEVNDTPIYAHTVLALLEKELSARARDMDAESFREFAAGRIVQQLHELIIDELDYTTAERSLTKEEKELATAHAGLMRADLIKRSGGSLEMARRQSAEGGYDLDELLRQTYRHLVVEIYQRRQIDPLVQVSVADMRAEYAAHGAKLYGDKDRLLFRVIEIDPAHYRGDHPRLDALTKIRALRQQALAGQDFTALASANNDDEGLKSAGGDVGGWLDRGSYRLDAVEAALWALSPGQVTDVVEVDGVFYLAKLMDKHVGHTRPFDDPTVQDDIYKRLSQQQRMALWQRVAESAEAEAVTSTPDEKLTTALEMVMQKYAAWAVR